MEESQEKVGVQFLTILKQALLVNRKPFPWVKAFCAGLAAALPIIIGLLFGNLQNGLLAGMGSFTYLYVFNIPYAQLAKKLWTSRLPHLITKTIRSQSQLLFILFSDQGAGFKAMESRELKKMRTNIMNLQTLFSTAAGEIPVNQKVLDYYWPVLFSIEQLGYLLENCSKESKRPNLPDETLAELLFVCESMANAANRKKSPEYKNIPPIKGFPSIQNELNSLQKSLQVKEDFSL
jgi:hypothetical protein